MPERPLMTRPIRRALLSVADRNGLAAFAKVLNTMGVALISTGGTAKFLRAESLPVIEVSEITSSPEILDGRVKTLHPHVHAGLLAKSDDDRHMQTLRRLGIEPIDLLVVNLYPFESAVESNASFDDCIENIDVGGPAMIRAAAKNHAAVAVVVDPDDYLVVVEELHRNSGALSSETRRRLATKAFYRTASYDAAVGNWLLASTGGDLPDHFAVGGKRVQKLRYGENPHQAASFYASGAARSGIAALQQVQGKELSYNNINDTDAAWQCVGEFTDEPACVIVKHANPCGGALGPTLAEAYRRALRCDTVSAFGGIVALNRPVDEETAQEIAKIFTEVIVAPDATAGARRVLAAKENLRLLLGPVEIPADRSLTVRSVAGGLLVQSADEATLDMHGLQVVTRRKPSANEIADLRFAFTIAKHVKSNAIVYAKNQATVGIGAGQMSRLDASRIAARKASEAAGALGSKTSLAVGSVVASDAFFPFADGLLAAAEAGATAVIQPGGSLRDDEVIAAADRAGLAMVFTGIRHFRH
jgi:phosphoribosylaminoimidazolecarboxamide formyltransferase/IMP cyclohydrolase